MQTQDRRTTSRILPSLPHLPKRYSVYIPEEAAKSGTDVSQPLSAILQDAHQPLDSRSYRLLHLILGQIGAASVSVVALSVAAGLQTTQLPLLQMVFGLILIRGVYAVGKPDNPVLPSMAARSTLKHIIKDELFVTIYFIAACTLMIWRFDRQYLAIFAAANLIGQIGHYYAARQFARLLKSDSGESILPHETQALIIGTGHRAQQLTDAILESHLPGISIRGFLDYHRKDLWRYRDVPLIGHPESLRKVVAQNHIDLILIAVDGADISMTKPVFRVAEKMGIPIASIPDTYRPEVARASAAQIAGIPAMFYHSAPNERLSLFAKEIIDRVGAVLGLVITSPIIALSALAIKMESRGPILFKQRRTGKNGRTFDMLKFRTMTIDADRLKDTLKDANEMSGPVFKIKNDPRVTRVGKLLRKYSIDEIPQFFNVLAGDMSLVGPRPPLPKEVAKYEPWQHRRLSVKPGLTCLWQINGRNQIDFEEWMFLDLEYIDTWSLWGDVKILAKTFPAVIRGTGS